MSDKSTEAVMERIMQFVGAMHQIGEYRYRETCACPECRAWRTLRDIDAKWEKGKQGDL